MCALYMNVCADGVRAKDMALKRVVLQPHYTATMFT